MRANSRRTSDARDRIERTERFVHQENRRIDRQRARQADALSLSAGQFVRPPGGVVVGRQAHELEKLCARARAFARQATARAAAPP